jgi:hypothetical protein
MLQRSGWPVAIGATETAKPMTIEMPAIASNRRYLAIIASPSRLPLPHAEA